MKHFIDDKEKMKDFNILTKEEFLKSYSYLTEIEYEFTKILDDIITTGLDIAVDNEANFGDVYVGGWSYEEYYNLTKQDIDITMFVDMIINEIEKDDRVLEVAGMTSDDTLDIIFTDKAIKDWENSFDSKEE